VFSRPAAGRVRAPRGRSAVGRDASADMSSGSRRAADASAKASPAAPRMRAMSGAAASDRAPRGKAGRGAQTAAGRTSGAGSTTRDATQGSPAPSTARAARAAQPARTAGRRRRTRATSPRTTSHRTGCDATATSTRPRPTSDRRGPDRVSAPHWVRRSAHDDPRVPAQQRLGRDEERLPRAASHHPARTASPKLRSACKSGLLHLGALQVGARQGH
jgi:hypothetical protein